MGCGADRLGFCFSCYGAHRDLHSCPTRRSSDLARRMRDIPPEKFDANAMGNFRQDEPLRKRRVRHVDLPIGRVTTERAEAYGLDYEKWYASYQAALRVDLA